MLLFLLTAFMNGVIREALWPGSRPRRQANNNGHSSPILNRDVISEAVEEDVEGEAADERHFEGPQERVQLEPPLPVEVGSEVIEEEPEQPVEVEEVGWPQEPMRFQPTPPVELASEVIEEEPKEEAAAEERFEVPPEPLVFQPKPSAEDAGAPEEPLNLGHAPLAEAYSQAMKEHRQQALAADVFGTSQEPPDEVEASGAAEELAHFGRTSLPDLYAQMVEPEPSQTDQPSLAIVDPQDVESEDSDSTEAPEDGDEEPRAGIEEAS